MKVELIKLANNNKLNAEDKRKREIRMILKLGLEQLGRLFYLLAEMEKREEGTDSREKIEICILDTPSFYSNRHPDRNIK